MTKTGQKGDMNTQPDDKDLSDDELLKRLDDVLKKGDGRQ